MMSAHTNGTDRTGHFKGLDTTVQPDGLDKTGQLNGHSVSKHNLPTNGSEHQPKPKRIIGDWAESQPWEKGSLQIGVTSLKYGGPSVKVRLSAASVMKEAAAVRLTQEIEAEAELMQYGNNRGDPKFRIGLATFLTKIYGAPVDRSDIFGTGSATQGLYTLATLLFQAGDIVFVEDPTYFQAKIIFQNDCDLTMVTVPSDDKGMDMDALDRLMTEHRDKGVTQISDTRPFRSLVYLIPCFHNPTTRHMPPERCQKVVELARKHDSLIVCDDVYNTLSWCQNPDGSWGNPPQRLFAYDKKTDPDYKGHVVSNGSFSKFMGPGLRLGWWEAPVRLHNIIKKSGFVESNGGFNQFTGGIMGTALELGLVEKHMRNVCKDYQDKSKAVYKILKEKMPKCAKFEEPQGGYFIWIELPEGTDVLKLRQSCIDEYQLTFLPGQSCSPAGNYKNCLRISFSYYPKEQLLKAVKILCEATTKFMKEL